MDADATATHEARRRKREARRARQRADNDGRAATMHAARLAWESEHGPAVPSEPDGPTPFEVHVGCSGWFYWHWKGAFYPAELPTRDWFAHDAGRFKTVELNAPFYSWPTVAAVKAWVRQAGRRTFVYTVKASELITHVKRFEGTRTLVKDFGHVADLLGPRTGCFRFQLPPSFHYTPARLDRVLSQLDPARRNVVEFRHKSWWAEAVYAAFRAAGAVFCSCSGPRLPDELVRTAEGVYVRFHRVKAWYRHDYTKAELAAWAGRIRASGARRVWAYFNNDRGGYAVTNARELLRLLRGTDGAAGTAIALPRAPAAGGPRWNYFLRKTSMKPVRGVLLDIDGTLVDSNDAHAHAWVEALAEAGRTVPFDMIRPLIGMGGDKLLPKACGLDAEAAEGKQVSKRRGEIFLAEHLPRLRPTRGARELLDLLKARGLRLVVASSAKKGELEPLMKLCGADRVCESATSSDDAGASKPDPDILHAALQSLGMPAAQAVMIGDTPYDVEAARRAGVRVIALRCGGWRDADLRGATVVYDDPADLAARLDDSPLFG